MFIAAIPILGSVFEFITNNLINLAGGFGIIFAALVTWFAKIYLVPFLQVEKRHRYARYIAAIADDVTDDLVQRYPDKSWLKNIDEAVDKIISICDIDTEIACRAASAALNRK